MNNKNTGAQKAIKVNSKVTLNPIQDLLGGQRSENNLEAVLEMDMEVWYLVFTEKV